MKTRQNTTQSSLNRSDFHSSYEWICGLLQIGENFSLLKSLAYCSASALCIALQTLCSARRRMVEQKGGIR